jgi:hypothetical protein
MLYRKVWEFESPRAHHFFLGQECPVTDDAGKLLEYLHELDNPQGTWVIVGQLEQAMGWDAARTEAAMAEVVANNYAKGTPTGNALMVPGRR